MSNITALDTTDRKVFVIKTLYSSGVGARGIVVGRGTMPQAGRSRVRVPMRFFNLPNPSRRTKVLGWTQPLTEMSTRNLPGG
jgi:hypothetical protein